MKRISIVLAALILVFFTACKSKDEKKEKDIRAIEKTHADTLLHEIDEIHMQGMGKMAKLTTLRQEATKLIDSIMAGTKKADASYKKNLDSVLQDLATAEVMMDKWMIAFYANTDTLSDNNEARINYLDAEKIKAANLRDFILNSIQKADSLLKVKH